MLNEIARNDRLIGQIEQRPSQSCRQVALKARFSKRLPKTQDELKCMLIGVLRRLQKSAHFMKACFRHSEFSYAACVALLAIGLVIADSTFHGQ